MTTLTLTGVTGKLGGMTAKIISDAGIKTRHLARSPEKAPRRKNSEIFESSYDKSEKTIEALKGTDILFMVSASENPNRVQQHKDFIDAAKIAGVKHIVYTSFYNASKKSVFTLGRDHYETEEYIKDNGFIYTFVRDNFYIDFFVDLCLHYNEIKGPAEKGKVSTVLRQDIAEVIAEILKSPEKWKNQTLNMTGPQELTMDEITETVAKYTGKNIKYINETVEEAYKSRKVWEAEKWEYDSWVSTYMAIAQGEQSGLSDDIERVLGRKPTSLSEYLKQKI